MFQILDLIIRDGILMVKMFKNMEKREDKDEIWGI